MHSRASIARSAFIPGEPRIVGLGPSKRSRPASSPEAGADRQTTLSRGVLAIVILLLATWALTSPRRAEAQDDVRNFRKPVLVVETEGHHAPVRSLIWPNPFSLLSAGQDKVVKVWDFRDGARLARTIRPMLWRGQAGIIYTMALTPKPDERGESYLAVAGYGVSSTGGDITVYRYPGRSREGTGEPVAHLRQGTATEPGHTNTVLCMAFDSTGTILASAGSDGTAILWDRDGGTFRHRKTLRGHTGEIHALAFTPDGARLLTAGWNDARGAVDGTLRTWDVATGAQVDLFSGPAASSAINTLAIHPDGQTAVIGREDGALLRLDVRNLAQIPPTALVTVPQQGPIETVAFSPDGTKLAVSLISNRANMADPKTLTCDVEVRDMPAGVVSHRRPGIPGLLYAASFSPDGGTLAYAGGHAQAIFLQDLRNLQNSPTELKGQGTTIMSVGFTADSQTVSFGRDANPAALDAGPAEGFDLKNRTYRPVERNEIRGPIMQHEGWTLRATLRPYRLEAVNADGRSWAVTLNWSRERNWWSHTIVPGNADHGHPKPTVAVGSEAGVVLFDLETGRRTRMFAGHGAPVTALAPSPDGRWLASGSIDQTIRIYPLSGCDTLPGFGAAFRQGGDASWSIDKVEPKSFAAAMGLQPGDLIRKAGILDHSGPRVYQKPEEIAEFTRRVEGVLPNDVIGIYVRRTAWIPGVGYRELNLPPLPSTKRNNPVLNLLVGLDKEWILWTPRGFYDTSIEGDSRLLGWQINPDFELIAPKPTDYLPVASFATKLIRGDILDRIWDTSGLENEREILARQVAAPAPNPNQPAVPPAPAAEPPATRLPEEIVAAAPPPRIEFASLVAGSPLPAPGGTWRVAVAEPKIKIQISAIGASKVKDRQVVIDGRLVSASLGEPRDTVGEEFAVNLTPDHPVRIAVKATNDGDAPRSESLDIVYVPPMPPPAPPAPARLPRLIVLGIGIDDFQNPSLPKLEFAPGDAQRVAEFLPQHLLAPSGTFAPGSAEDRVVLIGGAATAKELSEKLDQLSKQVRKKQLIAGDVVAVFLDSHVLEWEADGKKSTVVAPADLGEKSSSSSSAITTQQISEQLGAMADAGCRVVLFLDGVHLPSSGKGTPKSNIKPWVRDLQTKRRVITFVASKNGPSQVSRTERQGLFTLGLLNAFKAAQSTAGPKSLEAFKTAVVQEVRNLSNRYQEVGLFLPDSVPPRTPFIRP